ncbi:MAG: DUF362 domain-containing protein [Planctomycetota bacterium]|nr:DUF362 domain-containing protein [Planctomycetota bacterium]
MKPAEVFFSPVEGAEPEASILRKIAKVFDAAGLDKTFSTGGLVAVKVTFGERGQKTHLGPGYAKTVVDAIKSGKGKPFVVDTNTLYVGSRSNAVDHLQLAHDHGFSTEYLGAPVLIGDGLRGESVFIAETGSRLCKQAMLCGVARATDSIIAISHMTGHLGTGFACAIKNIGMGFAARGGKLAQHSGFLPQVAKSKCRKCGECAAWCPADAISCGPDGASLANIDESRCIGCGECLAVCPHHAIKIAWDESTANLQKKMAEYCKAVVAPKAGRVGFINVLVRITKDCDCMAGPEKPIVPDIGVLASTDCVAVDKASVDLIIERAKRDVFKEAWPDIDHTVQLKYAAEIGLGRINYRLVTL